jgi:hypothetical protein
LKTLVVGRKDRGRERGQKEEKKEEKSASDKLEFLLVHAPHIHESDAEIKLNQSWNDFFCCWNQLYTLSEDSGMADVFLTHVIIFLKKFLFFKRPECPYPTPKTIKRPITK